MLETPMLRVRILFNRNFLIATIIGMLVQASLLVAPVLMPIYVQDLLGYSATVSGLVIMPGAIIMGIMNPIAGRIFDKHGARAMGIIGMLLLAATTLGFVFVGTDTSIAVITILFAVRMFSMALVNMPHHHLGHECARHQVHESRHVHQQYCASGRGLARHGARRFDLHGGAGADRWFQPSGSRHP